jgi:hypothetical protein
MVSNDYDHDPSNDEICETNLLIMLRKGYLNTTYVIPSLKQVYSTSAKYASFCRITWRHCQIMCHSAREGEETFRFSKVNGGRERSRHFFGHGLIATKQAKSWHFI